MSLSHDPGGDAQRLVLQLFLDLEVDVLLAARQVHARVRPPSARLDHGIAMLLHQLELEVGPVAVGVKHELARQARVLRLRK